MQLGAPLLAMVAAGVHRGRQRLRVAKHAREHRHRHRRERPHATQRAAREPCAARDLRRVRRVHLPRELGHEPERDAQHHAKLVRRHAHARKWGKQALEGGREVERGGREGYERHARHHRRETHDRGEARAQAALAYLKDAPRPQRLAGLVGEQPEHAHEHHDGKHGRKRSQRTAGRDARHAVQRDDKERKHGKRHRCLPHERHDEEAKPKRELGARVHPMQWAVARPVTAKGEGVRHATSPSIGASAPASEATE